MENIQNYYVQNSLIDANSYQYYSQFALNLRSQLFCADDYISIISARMKDIFSSAGSITFVYYGDNTLEQGPDNSQPPVSFYVSTPISSASDAMFAINSQTQGKFGLFSWLDVVFSFTFLNLAKNWLLTATGNLQNIFGLQQPVFYDQNKLVFQLLEDNACRIKYIKICCEQIDGNLQTFQGEKIEFENSVLVLITQSSSFQYTNKNLDVHLKLNNNPPLMFKLLDQDNRPVNISYCILHVQLYKADALNFTNEVGASSIKGEIQGISEHKVRGHTKQQCFLHLSSAEKTISFNKFVNNISVSQVSGQMDSILFDRRSSSLQIFQYDVCQHFKEEEQIRCFQTFSPTYELKGFFFYKPYQQIVYNFTEVYLYDQPDFKEYRDKFIDYQFFAVLQNFLLRYFFGKLNISLVYNRQNDSLTTSFNNIFQLNMFDLNEFIYYFVQAPSESILYGILKENPPFRFTNLDALLAFDGKQKNTLLNVLIGNKNIILRENSRVEFHNPYVIANKNEDAQGVYPYLWEYTMQNILFSYFVSNVRSDMFYDVDTLDVQYFKVNYMAYSVKDNIYAISDAGRVNSVSRCTENQFQDDLPPKDDVFTHNSVVPFTKNAQASFYVINSDNKPQQLFNYSGIFKLVKPVAPIVYYIDSLKMFRYSNMFYLFCREYPRCLGVVIGTDLILQPLNVDVFVWCRVQETDTLNFYIKQYIEKEDNTIVEVQSEYIPDLYIRLLMK